MKFWKSILWVVLGIEILVTLCAFFMILRGFRANETPSKFETVIARAVRDASIPLAERRQKNPLRGDAEASQQGRELFLSRCAACHGIDGSGVTAVGANLYPRARDLRQSATQNLTDGQMHYIIEYGVRFTGMPGQRNPHRLENEDSWKLALFVRSLQPLSHAEKTEQASMLASAHYVGSQACEQCHEQIYQRWKKTPMANVVRDPRTHPNAIIPDLATNTASKFTVDQVAFVYGSIWKQRYFTKVGDGYAPLPVQWDIGNHKWLPYQVPDKGADWWAYFYPSDNMQRPTGPTCDGCHSVDYNIQTHQVAEWNVGCERCHGPGSEHVQHPTRGNIVNPDQMDSVAANDTCIQCHSQGRPLTNPIEGKYYDWSAIVLALVYSTIGSWKLVRSAKPTSTIFPTALRTRTGCRGMTLCRA